MKKFLLFGICLLGCSAIAFEAGDSADKINPVKMDIRPKTEIVENISIPLAEPIEVEETEEIIEVSEEPVTQVEEIKEEIIQEAKEEILPESGEVILKSIEVKLPEEDLKSIEEIQAQEEEEISEEVSEPFNEEDFQTSDDDIKLEVNVGEKTQTLKQDLKKFPETSISGPDRKKIMVTPYDNNSGTIYRF